MKQIIQLFKLIFDKDFHNSIEHYSQDEIVKFYNDLATKGLFPDEVEVLNLMLLMNIKTVLLVGAGAGREARVFVENSIKVHAVEPVDIMRMHAYQHSEIKYYKSIDQINAQINTIFITRNLLSLLDIDERHLLLNQIFAGLENVTNIFLQADIMELTWRDSFKLKFLEQVGRWSNLKKKFIEGDTYRINIDYNAKNSNWCFYHYYPTKEIFLNDIKRYCPNGNINELSGGFFYLQLVKD